MHGSIRNKAVVFSILIVLVASVTTMIGAVLVSIRQMSTANGEHLGWALESVSRHFNEELQGIKSLFDGFADDPMNNYFIYNSIDISYFLWQDNSAILQLYDQMNADRMGFFYRSPDEVKGGPDRLHMFRTKDKPLYQIEADGHLVAVSLDEFGAPRLEPQQAPVSIPFDSTYESGPMYAFYIRDGLAVIVYRFELKRLSGEHLGYFVFERSVGLDTYNLDRELGVYSTFYDLSGTPAKSKYAMEPLLPKELQNEDISLSAVDGETFDARIGTLCPISDPIGYISVGIPTAETTSRIRQTVLILSILALLISIPISAVFGMTVSRYLQPIITLTEVAQEMAKGNLDHKLSAHDRDEIGVLAGSFANMRNVIQQKIEELQTVNEELDKRVEKRSAELAQQNDMLNGLLDVLEDAVYFKDMEGRYTRVNAKYARKLGKVVTSSVVGKKDSDFAGSMTNRIRIAEDAQILKNGLTVKNLAGMSFTEDGRRVEEIWNKQPLRNADGEVVGMFTVIREIRVANESPLVDTPAKIDPSKND